MRAGEIVGVAGVEGNGQRELVEAIAGMRPPQSGQIDLLGKDITKANPRQTHRRRRRPHPRGPRAARPRRVLLARRQPRAQPLSTRSPSPTGFIRDFDAVRTNAEALFTEFDVRAPGVAALAGSLSGGNKQKVVVAREMSFGPKLLMAAQPTRGVDVGSIEFIHRRIVAARDEGAAVLLVSAELDEILSLADRIAVIHGGKVVAEMPAADADRTEIGRLMAGDH